MIAPPPPYPLGTYIPRKEAIVEETIRATIIKPNQAIKLRARKETLDRDGTPRVTGEEWLVNKVGAYLPGAYEEVVDIVDAFVLTEKVCVVSKTPSCWFHTVHMCRSLSTCVPLARSPTKLVSYVRMERNGLSRWRTRKHTFLMCMKR